MPTPTVNPAPDYSLLNDILTPGTFVQHMHKPDWGVGQVQSNAGNKITVNFEHRGKVVFSKAALVLRPIVR